MVFGVEAQGLYSLKFHYCQNSLTREALPYSFTVGRVCWCTRVSVHARPLRTLPRPLQVEVTEKNPGGYLSATEIPLSRLYIGMAAVFFTAAMIWVYTLMKHRYSFTPWNCSLPVSAPRRELRGGSRCKVALS